ncbi:MAG: coproporphyrinogen III oxidase, partial [Planctomycetota bacterium]|nr:coproporphyrinogen III oxidase [Planctomycetota bacterium]
TGNLVKIARELGFKGVNVDLIYGLPHQTVETFEKTVQAVIDMGCDRAAVYSFAYVPWVRGHQKMMETAALPEPEEKAALFGAVREIFLAAGFEPIGMDHFALPTDELAKARVAGKLRRNFQGYAVIPATDVIGLGISAIGDVGGLYVQNAKKLTTYREAIEAGELSASRGVLREGDDELRRAVIHDLMCNFKIDVKAHEERFGIDFMEYFAPD